MATTTKMENGGWYEGRQYWEGSLGEKGVINNPNQVGYGQKVSDEVNLQSDKAQGLAPGSIKTYLGQTSAGGQTSQDGSFQNAGDVSSFLNDFQTTAFNTPGGMPTPEQLKASLTPTTTKPELINRAETREALRTKYGVPQLEDDMTQLRAEQRAIEDQKTLRRQAAEGGAVPLGVIEGRVSEIERQENERLMVVSREIASVADQLNVKYNVIGQFVQDLGLDYQDAVQRYDTEFSQNMQVYDALLKTRSQQLDEAKFGYQQQQDKLAAARTNLQMYVNAISKGNLDYGSLGADQKAMISKLEVQSGIPVGFIGKLKIDPGADILFTTTNEGVTQVGFRQADGSVKVESYGTRTAGAKSQKENEVLMSSNAISAFNTVKGQDGFVDPKDFKTFKNQWVSMGGSAESFNTQFAQYVNPASPSSYGVSKELVNPDYYKDQNAGF